MIERAYNARLLSLEEAYGLLGVRRSDYVALWKVFIDDSADGHRKQYVIAGAFIGKLRTWQAFQRKWNRTLRQSPRIRYLHGSELRQLDGEFAQFRDVELWPAPTGRAAANAKRDTLRRVIEAHELIGCGVGVHIPDYDRVRETHPRAKTFLGKDAFEYALQALIYEITKTIAEHDKHARVAFVSDDSNKASRYTEVYTKWKAANPKTARSMLGISHLDDKIWPGLQAADMGASTVKMVFDEHFSKGETKTAFPLRDHFYRIANVGEKYLLTMLEHQSVREVERSRDSKREIRRSDKGDSVSVEAGAKAQVGRGEEANA